MGSFGKKTCFDAPPFFSVVARAAWPLALHSVLAGEGRLVRHSLGDGGSVLAKQVLNFTPRLYHYRNPMYRRKVFALRYDPHAVIPRGLVRRAAHVEVVGRGPDGVGDNKDVRKTVRGVPAAGNL